MKHYQPLLQMILIYMPSCSVSGIQVHFILSSAVLGGILRIYLHGSSPWFQRRTWYNLRLQMDCEKFHRKGFASWKLTFRLSEEVPFGWRMANVVSVFKKNLVIPGLSVSLQCLPKLWGRFFWELLKITRKQCHHWSQLTWLHEGKVLFDDFNLLLWWVYPSSWPKEVRWCNF